LIVPKNIAQGLKDYFIDKEKQLWGINQ
jgi:hypothetical protein